MEEPRATQKAKGPSPMVAQVQVADSRLDQLEKMMEKVLTHLSQMSNQTSPPRRGPAQERRREQPSKDRPCHICGSAQHWASTCPKKRQNWSGHNKRSGNDRGLDQRSEGQSGNKQ